MNGNNALKGIALACAIAAGSACTGVKKTTTDLNPAYSRPSTCAAAIAVYNSRADVPYDYYELAWIEATGNSVWTTDNQLQTQIRNGAAKVGSLAKQWAPTQQRRKRLPWRSTCLATRRGSDRPAAPDASWCARL